MFDWNEDEEGRDTIWGVLNETEDHIVPYPKENEGEYSKKQRQESTGASSLIISSHQAKSTSQNGFPSSDFNPNEELSASRFDMDPWPDLPSLNSAFGKGVVNAPEGMVNGLYDGGAAIVESKNDSLKDPCGEPGSSFLDCDWGNIADFDDFDRIFRNDDTLFGSEIIGHGDEDDSSAAAPSFPIADLRDEQPAATETASDTVDVVQNNVAAGVQAMDSRGKRDHSSDGGERPKKSKSRKQMEEKGPSGIHQFKSPFQRVEDGGAPLGGIFSGAGKFFRPPFEYPAVHAFSPAPTIAAAGESPRVYQASSKHPSSMTPQEKIEKLRRRQQMQAMLAIQQQQQQIEQKSSSTEMSATQISPPPNQNLAADDAAAAAAAKFFPSSELSFPPEGDDLPNSSLIDDSLGEKIFYQLQDAIAKLEVGVRLCIRDSLLRLGKSAAVRHNAGDRSSANKNSREDEEAPIEEDKRIRERFTKPPAETGTNPIDRIVAHLLFHWPSEPAARPVKEELLPSLSFPASKLSNLGEDVSQSKLQREDPPEAQNRGP